MLKGRTMTTIIKMSTPVISKEHGRVLLSKNTVPKNKCLIPANLLCKQGCYGPKVEAQYVGQAIATKSLLEAKVSILVVTRDDRHAM